MLREVIWFEWKYRLRRPATFIYFGILFFMAFGAVSLENLTVGGTTGLVKQNSPYQLSLMTVVLTAIPGFFISSAIMGVPVVRDADNNTQSMIYTSPITKLSYLTGRFWGAFLVCTIIFMGIPLGFLMGSIMPWLDESRFLDIDIWNYFQPFFLFAIPNIFISGALFFMVGTLSRKMLMVFFQGILFLAVYFFSFYFTERLNNVDLAALLDPIGINLLGIVSRYWTVAEQNSNLYELEGLILNNRLIWVGIGFLGLGITYLGFSFQLFRKSLIRFRLSSQTQESSAPSIPEKLSFVKKSGFWVELKRIFSLSTIYFRDIIYSIPFLAIVLVGMFLLLSNTMDLTSWAGTRVFPTTYIVLQEIEQFNLFFMILIAFYSGELVWRERDVEMNLIYDSLPIADFVKISSKFLTMIYMHLSLSLVLLLTGVLIQSYHGYYDYNLKLYVFDLFVDNFIFLLLATFLAFFIHVIVNQKFVGHIVFILFFLLQQILSSTMGWEHSLVNFASARLEEYSDMNGYGHFLTSFTWLNIYWLAITLFLFMIAAVMMVRGTDTKLSTRLYLARLRLSRPIWVSALLLLIVFFSSGFYVYYNNNVLNQYQNTEQLEIARVEYEKTLNNYQYALQPKIVETFLQIDLYPSERDFIAEGYYILKNKTDSLISRIHIQHNRDPQVQNEYLRFERKADIIEPYPSLKHFVYELEEPLLPGDSLRMDFRTRFYTKGFVTRQENTQVVYNGTIFDNSYFPTLGYDIGQEITDNSMREKYELSEREPLAERSDELAQRINMVSDDADRVRLEMIISTDPNQIAIAPGELIEEWIRDDRKFYHYKEEQPILNFYSILSAEYKLKSENWISEAGDTVLMEIYYHDHHDYNLDRMMTGARETLDYCSRAFGKYPFHSFRIAEFPRYRTSAASFAGIVPFSEETSFIADVDENDGEISIPDYPYYATAQETADQWWAQQVPGANVKGGKLLSEGIGHYLSILMMSQKMSSSAVNNMLEYELRNYLLGRKREFRHESPLIRVENHQSYLFRYKASLAFFTLKEYIGEDNLNNALKAYFADWENHANRYATTDVLVEYLLEEAPDSLDYIVEDWFRKIVLYENRAEEARASLLGNGKYEVLAPLRALKYEADSLGNETVIPLRDWIEVGVWAENANGEDSLIYREKHLIDNEYTLLELEVSQRPDRIAIDPFSMLVDRNPRDNVARVVVEGEK